MRIVLAANDEARDGPSAAGSPKAPGVHARSIEDAAQTAGAGTADEEGATLEAWLSEAGVTTEKLEPLLALLRSQWVADVPTLRLCHTELRTHLPAAAYAVIARAIDKEEQAIQAARDGAVRAVQTGAIIRIQCPPGPWGWPLSE